MSTSEQRRCGRCGASIPAGSADGLCPACLLSGAIEAPKDETLTIGPDDSGLPRDDSGAPRQLAGYRILGRLGTGGMGAVYEAEQLATGRRVALKMLSGQLDSPDMRQRFLREGRLAASVSHPNSLYVFGSEEIAQVPVITMEIAEGGTLRDRLERRGPFPVESAVDAILDVIAGLEAAWTVGVLHRDVKPSNCFVGPDGSVKVGDYGLSVSTMPRDDSYVTATGVIMGTPAFAPPEQLRGDELDVRADIYSVGATLYTLLTGRPPFEGRNAVQVVANVMNRKPAPMSEQRGDLPPGLERVVARCMSKEPAGRYPDYAALRSALLPHSSRVPQPAPTRARVSAGWIDYLIGFMVPYVPMMLAVGAERFHVRPLIERSLESTGFYLATMAFGILYFTISEGIWGAGVGKHLLGLRVVREHGRPPGLLRASLRILIPLLACEGVRIPLLLATIRVSRVADMTSGQVVLFFAASFLCPCIPALMMLSARRDNGFASIWDLASGTRVVRVARGAARPPLEATVSREAVTEDAGTLGPYRVIEHLVPGRWLRAVDPVLRRPVWLLRRDPEELSAARRAVSRPGRLRWLQGIDGDGAAWDAFEAPSGKPFRALAEGGRCVRWETMRRWLHDLASELRAGSVDGTLPAEAGLDHVWITAQGHAVLIDRPWPRAGAPAGSVPIDHVHGQQRFLHTVASRVDPTGLPLHARPVLQNIARGRFEKISFLAGILQGFLDRPAEVGRAVRAGAMFLLPFYIWVMVFVGSRHGAEWLYAIIGHGPLRIAVATGAVVLVGAACVQLLAVPCGSTVGHSVFRLAVVDGSGRPAAPARLLARWAIAWLPLLIPLAPATLWMTLSESRGFALAAFLAAIWLGAAAVAVFSPARGLHDRWAGTWVVHR